MIFHQMALFLCTNAIFHVVRAFLLMTLAIELIL